MTTPLYLARGAVRGRIHHPQDPALSRTVELARKAERQARRRR